MEKNKNNLKETLKTYIKHPFFSFIAFGLVLLFIPLLSKVIGVTLTDAIAKTLIFYIIALGFSLLMGYGGLASLGTASFIGIGSFILFSAMDVFSLPFILALIIGLVIAVLLGLVFGVVSLRIEGMYLAIVTLGLSEIAVELFKNFDKFTGGVSGTTFKGINILGLSLNTNQTLVLIIIVVVIAMMLTHNLIKSPTGRALLSIKNSSSAAQAMGISVLKYRLLAFIISTVYAVIGGMLYMGYVRYSMGSQWSLSISLNLLAAVVVGGSKSIWGVLIGTFVIFGLDLAVFKTIPFLRDSQFSNMSFVISGVLIIVVLMYFPGGLIGLFQNLYYKIKSKLAKKKQVEEVVTDESN